MGNKDGERRFEDFPFSLPHERFAEEFAKNPAAFEVHEQLPRTYREHPITVAHGPQSKPLGLYSDGVPHTKRDSFLAYYWSSLSSGERSKSLLKELRSRRWSVGLANT